MLSSHSVVWVITNKKRKVCLANNAHQVAPISDLSARYRLTLQDQQHGTSALPDGVPVFFSSGFCRYQIILLGRGVDPGDWGSSPLKICGMGQSTF